ncbi:translationally-controlled tumor protein [Streptomyces sp. ODS28]|uniref:translationally-controlled tumor protein n=1 Tax=Streptomyces sp. ODS28 TaxID=3136688 RepID=UPI0031EE53D1
MISYRDIVSNDIMFSDEFPLRLVDDVVFEVACPPDVDGHDSADSVVHRFGLEPVTFDKRSYLSHLKHYMGAVKIFLAASGAGQDEVTAFEKGASAYAKQISANFKNYAFYTGMSKNPDGLVGLKAYRADGSTYFTFWRHGLKEQRT